jgi:hypothetical protein
MDGSWSETILHNFNSIGGDGDEQVLRFNNRKDGERKITDSERFAAAMSGLAGRRLTYSDLTGKSDSPHHETTGTRTEEPF